MWRQYWIDMRFLMWAPGGHPPSPCLGTFCCKVFQGQGLWGKVWVFVWAESAVESSIQRLYGQSRPNKDVRCCWLLVVGDGRGSVIEDMVVGGDRRLVERVA